MAKITKRDPDIPGTFAYEAISPNGARVKGPRYRMSAYSIDDVRRELIDQGFTPIKITEIGSGGINMNMKVGRQGLKLKPLELAAFARGLHQLLRAGISVPRAVEALGEDASSPELAELCKDISTKISNGTTVSEAFSSHPQTFDDVFCGYLSAGEQTGSLVVSTRRLAELTEKRAQLSNKVRAVSIYPILVSVVISLLMSGIILFLVPKYEAIYAQFHAKLPAPTLALVALSHHFMPLKFYGYIPGPNLTAPLFWILGILIGLRIFLKKKKDDPKVGTRVDKIRFRMPIIGKLTHLLALFRWTSTLTGALESGVRTTQALEMAADASGSKWIKAIRPDLEAGLQAGRPLSGLLAEYPTLFPATIRTMVATGEQSGELASMLDSSAAQLSDEIDAIVSGLGAKIEVALIVVMGAVVGSMLVCLYLPIINLAATVSNTATSSTGAGAATTTTIPGQFTPGATIPPLTIVH